MTASDIPATWVSSSLLAVAEFVRGVSYSKSDASDKASEGTVPVLRSNNITSDGFDFSELVYVKHEFIAPTQFVCTGDVVIATSSGSINVVGKAVQADRELGMAFGAFCGLLRPAPQIDPRYFGYFFRTSIYRKATRALAQGVNINNLKRSHFEAIQIPIAPVNEQEQIADRLDMLIAHATDCRNRVRLVISRLATFRESILAAAGDGRLTKEWRHSHRAAFPSESLAKSLRAAHDQEGGHIPGNAAAPTEGVHTMSDDELPNGWEIVELRDICEPGRPITYGILKPGPDLPAGIPYIRVADFSSGKLNEQSIRRTSEQIAEQYKRSRLRKNDLLISIRGSAGHIVQIPPSLDGANITQDSARISVSPQVSTEFVKIYLASPRCQARIQAAVKGVAVRGVNIGDVRALQVALPPLTEQLEIVKRVGALEAVAANLEFTAKSASSQIEELFDSILTRAYQGKLVPQVTDGEPVATLLQQINEHQASLRAIKMATEKPSIKSAVVKRGVRSVCEVLRDAVQPISAQTLLERAGYPIDVDTEKLDEFFLDLRDALNAGVISKQRRGNQDYFSLIK